LYSNDAFSLSIKVPKLSKASDKLFITDKGNPTPGGTDDGIGNCFIKVFPALKASELLLQNL
jgi:hypothetical protein